MSYFQATLPNTGLGTGGLATKQILPNEFFSLSNGNQLTTRAFSEWVENINKKQNYD